MALPLVRAQHPARLLHAERQRDDLERARVPAPADAVRRPRSPADRTQAAERRLLGSGGALRAPHAALLLLACARDARRTRARSVAAAVSVLASRLHRVAVDILGRRHGLSLHRIATRCGTWPRRDRWNLPESFDPDQSLVRARHDLRSAPERCSLRLSAHADAHARASADHDRTGVRAVSALAHVHLFSLGKAAVLVEWWGLADLLHDLAVSRREGRLVSSRTYRQRAVLAGAPQTSVRPAARRSQVL